MVIVEFSILSQPPPFLLDFRLSFFLIAFLPLPHASKQLVVAQFPAETENAFPKKIEEN